MLLPGGVLCVADLDTELGVFHSAEAAASVHHHGFDRPSLQEQLRTAGFADVTVSTAHVIGKPVDGGDIRNFSVFLMVGRRQ